MLEPPRYITTMAGTRQGWDTGQLASLLAAVDRWYERSFKRMRNRERQPFGPRGQALTLGFFEAHQSICRHLELQH